MSFWHTLPKPIIVLAPMADVTDAAFRRIIAKYSAHIRKDGTIGGPDVMWTEFVSADGLMRAPEEGRAKLLADLMFTDTERPIVAQLFTSVPEHMESAAALCAELGFDGIDINMGCPDRTIEKQGCCAAMIKHPGNARDIIRAAKRGATKNVGNIAVSVKTRIGYNRDELETWLPILLEEAPDVITVHARTRKEMSKVPARWEHVAHAVRLRDSVQTHAWLSAHSRTEKTLILGNGDLTSVYDAENHCCRAGADGAMLGRAIFGNPWLFHPTIDLANVSLDERLRVMLEHTRQFEQLLPFKNFALMKKHYRAYVSGFRGAHELRAELMECASSDEMKIVVNRFLHNASEVS